MAENKNSAAKIKANHKYDASTYDRITFRVRKENTEELKAAAAAAGQSVNGYILEAVKMRMKAEA